MGPEGVIPEVRDWLEGTDSRPWSVHSPDLVLRLDRSTAVEELVTVLQLHGLDPRVVDLTPLSGKAELLESLHRTLELDPWFGFNWDALEEALHGPEKSDAPERVLVCSGFQEFCERAPADAGVLLNIIRAVARIPTSGLRGCVLIG